MRQVYFGIDNNEVDLFEKLTNEHRQLLKYKYFNKDKFKEDELLVIKEKIEMLLDSKATVMGYLNEDDINRYEHELKKEENENLKNILDKVIIRNNELDELMIRIEPLASGKFDKIYNYFKKAKIKTKSLVVWIMG